MRRIVFCLFFSALLNPAHAQKLYPINTLRDSARFQLVVQQGQLALQWVDAAPVWQKRQGFPEIRAVRLEDADLVLEYLPVQTGGQSSYVVALRIASNDGPLLAPQQYEISESNFSEGNQSLRRQVWQDAAETLFEPGKTYTLHLRRDLMKPVDCKAERPTFTLKQKLPYYGTGVAALVGGGAGLYLLKRSNEEYDLYREYWAEARSQTEAQPFLDRAKRFRTGGQVLCYGSLAILGADAVFYWLRLRRVQKRQGLYDEFCAPKTSYWEVRPLVAPTVQSVNRQTLGFSLKARF